MTAFAIDLPLPTSANRIWRKGKGKGGKTNIYRNPDYDRWVVACDGVFMANGFNRGRQAIAGRFVAKVFVREGIRLDPDNIVKPLLDWAQHAGVIKDDKHLRSLKLEYGDIGGDCRLVIEAVA